MMLKTADMSYDEIERIVPNPLSNALNGVCIDRSNSTTTSIRA